MGQYGTATALPGLPPPSADSLVDSAEKVKQIIEVWQGARGDGLDRVVTMRDLLDMQVADEPTVRQVLAAVGVASPPPSVSAQPLEPAVPPTPATLTASGAFANIVLSWTFPITYARLAYFEVWRSATNALGDAVLIAQPRASMYSDDVGPGVSFYYWVRAVSDGGVSPFNAVAGTRGSTSADPNAVMRALLTKLGYANINIEAGVFPITSIDTLPALPDDKYPPGVSVLNLADGKLYRNISDEWTAAVEAVDIAGEITTTQISDDAITTPKLVAGAVTTAKVAAGAITANEIAANAIVAGKIAAGAIIAGDGVISNAAITTALIANGAILNAQIGDAAIDSAKIANAAITSAKIGLGEITTANIRDANITTAKIANAAITTAVIADAAITTAKIVDLAVGSAKIADAAITTAKIANLAVGSAQIVDAAITTAKIANLAVGSAQIADAAITNAKVGAAAIDSAKIANAAITTAKIGDLQVNTIKIANAAVTNPVAAYSSSAGSAGSVVQSLSITTDGGVVMLQAGCIISNANNSNTNGSLALKRDTTTLVTINYTVPPWDGATSSSIVAAIPPYKDSPAAGTYTYSLEAASGLPPSSMTARGLFATEIKK